MTNSAAELAEVMKPFRHELDDDVSVVFLARLREQRLLDDAEWGKIKDWVVDALQFLVAGPPTAFRDEHGRLTIDPNADPRNRDWLRLVEVWNRTGHVIPGWAALWLWWL